MALSFDLLAIGLRSRAGSVAEVAGLARRDVAVVREQLQALAEAGYLTLQGDRVVYEHASGAVASDVRRRAGVLLSELSGLIGDLTTAVDHLPVLVDAEGLGLAGSPMSVEVFHGESAVTDLWHHLLQRMPLRHTDVVLPDGSSLGVADPQMQATWHSVIAAEGNRARVVGSVADAIAPELRGRVSEELAAGLEIRFMQSPPSWFWVADAQVVALPLVWGETWPTSVIAITSPAVAGLASWVFETLWVQAVEPLAGAHSWDALLRVMATGSTLEAAAHTLGISDRTGRRRIAEAMEHYGVNNLLALGMLWGRQHR